VSEFRATAPLYKSADGGASWTEAGSGLPECCAVTLAAVSALAIDPQNGNTLYAGTPAGVFKSVDGGANWNRSGLDTAVVHSLTIDPHNPDRVYAVTDAGLFQSLNSGTTWTEASGGPSWPMTSLTIDPLDSNRVYAGSAGGIFVITFESDSGRVQDEPRGN
jgi:photosystem II stability/assembly factor-like uncharacterized protein